MRLFCELETERLFLKNISSHDRDFIYKQFSNAQVNKYLFDEEPCATMEEADGIIKFYIMEEPRMQHRWILVDKATGSKMGTCGYHCWNPAEGYCEIGYDLYPDYQGKGYMTEAVREILRFGREKMLLRQIDAHIYVDNIPSKKIAEKLGFVLDKEKVFYEEFRGTKYPHMVYSLKWSS